MPIYEYTCPSCRKVFEEWVKTHDTAARPCPDCGAMAPHIVSNTTFVLKGGGWYVTEYGNRKSESDPPKASPEASPETSSAPSPGTPSPARTTDNAAAPASPPASPAPAAAASGNASASAA